MPSLITAGGLTVGAQIVSATDGALTLQTGPDGSKVNALAIDASGNTTAVAVNGTTMQQGGVAMPRMVLSTAQNTTSGNTITFSSIPSWVKRITFVLNEVSTSGTANMFLRLGTSGGIESTGYLATYFGVSGTTGQSGSDTTGIIIYSAAGTYVTTGMIQLVNISSNTWIASGTYKNNVSTSNSTNASKALSGTLDRVALVTTDTFDAGSVNILYEG